MEDKKWSWGFMSYDVKIVNGVLTWKGGGKSASYPLNSINGIQYEAGLMTASFRVIASGADNDKLVIPKNEKSRNMIDEMNAYLAEYKKLHNPSSSTPSTDTNMVADELIKLKNLVDAGVLTQQEFDEQKRKLLNR